MGSTPTGSTKSRLAGRSRVANEVSFTRHNCAAAWQAKYFTMNYLLNPKVHLVGVLWFIVEIGC